MPSEGKALALAVGLFATLAFAVVNTVSASLKETPKPTPKKKTNQSFSSITPRGYVWWELSKGETWLSLPRTLVEDQSLLALWEKIPASSTDQSILYENVVECFVQSGLCPKADKDQILRDIPRTFPEIEYFSDPDVQDSMERVLMSVCVEYPKLGYVQSMNFLVAFLFLHSKTEDACFTLFRVMLEHELMRMDMLFCKGLPLLFRLLYTFEKLLSKHAKSCLDQFQNVGLDTIMFAQTWFMTLFTYSMDWAVCGSIWEEWFNKGWEPILQVACYFVKSNEEAIVSGTFESISHILRNVAAEADQDLMDRVNRTIQFDSEDVALCREVTAGL